MRKKKSWLELYNGESSYQSDTIKVNSDFNFLMEEISTNYTPNNGEVVVEIRVSEDGGVTWGEWKVVGDYHESPFHSDHTGSKSKAFQYRVLMKMKSMGGKSPTFNSFSINFTGVHKIINSGDVVCKPEFWIRKVNGFGDIEVKNETNGMTMAFVELSNNEEVYVNCEQEDIVSSIPLVYRYNNHNNVFLELEVGENLISGSGDFEMDMRFQFKTLQG